MKKRMWTYVILAGIFSFASQIVHVIWQYNFKSNQILGGRYYIGAVIMGILGALELLFLYKFRNEVRQTKLRRHQAWCNIADFIFYINCIGIPIILLIFILHPGS